MQKYYDYAAATPVSDSVMAAMQPYFSEIFYNPSALYGRAREARAAVDQARHDVALSIGARPEEIIFTSGCTESNNLAIHGVMQGYPGKKVLVSMIEHDSVRVPAMNYNVDYIPVRSNGVVDLAELQRMLEDSDIVLVSVMSINNEIGTAQPLRKISEIIKQARMNRGEKGLPIYFHADMAQAPNVRSIAVSANGADMMSFSGAKIYGPKGVGCLYVSRGLKLTPVQLGGGQERGVRSGTENVASIVGFSTALSEATASYKAEADRLCQLTGRLQAGLERLGATVLVHETCSITSVVFDEKDNEYLLYELDTLGYSMATGSACHASSSEKSHVLAALGLTDTQAKGSLRLSLGRQSSAESVDHLLKDLKEVLANS
jgi:cysteine desulfurase